MGDGTTESPAITVEDWNALKGERDDLLVAKTKLEGEAVEFKTRLETADELTKTLSSEKQNAAERFADMEADNRSLAVERDEARERLADLAATPDFVRSVLAVDHPEEQLTQAVGALIVSAGLAVEVEAGTPLPMIDVPVPGDPAKTEKRLAPDFALAVAAAFQIDRELGDVDLTLDSAGKLVAWLCGRLGGAFTRKDRADNPPNNARLLATAEWFSGYHGGHAEKIRKHAMGEDVDRGDLEAAASYLHATNKPRGTEFMQAIGMPVPDLV